MELANTFFYTIPGPKMIWQFGELGYDVTIDSGGRTGIKPIHWDYYNDTRRRHLFEVNKSLIKLRNDEPVFATKNFTLNVSGNIKKIELADTITKVIVVGNFDMIDNSYTINFPVLGSWYEFFTGDSINITNASYPVTLKAGEYRLYANKKLTGFASIPTRLNQVITNNPAIIYPNPFSSKLFIQSKENINEVELCNLQGQTLIHAPLNNLKYLDTGNLAAGVYLLVIHYADGKMETVKVVKVH
jgi:hypothetical protein